MGQERHDEDLQGERYQMKHIYIVMGSHGEYSDFQEWPVVAYTKESKAIEHVEKAYDRAQEIQKEFSEALRLKATAYWKRVKAIDQSNEYDKECNSDHGSGEVTYCMWTVRVKE